LGHGKADAASTASQNSLAPDIRIGDFLLLGKIIANS
jgi:hypothetical protein